MEAGGTPPPGGGLGSQAQFFVRFQGVLARFYPKPGDVPVLLPNCHPEFLGTVYGDPSTSSKTGFTSSALK
jgi:hypothetical protein